jgi:hypothetical protein
MERPRPPLDALQMRSTLATDPVPYEARAVLNTTALPTNTAGFEYGSLPIFFIYRGGTGICVRPNRYALARWLGVPLEPGQLALHECDHPSCVKVCAADAPRQHVVAGDQIENMRRMARMRRGGGRSAIPSDGLHARRQRSVALRAVLRERGWDRAAVEASLLGDMPTLW